MPRGAVGGKCNMFGRIFQLLEIFLNIGGETVGSG